LAAARAAQDVPHWRDWLAHEAEDDWWDELDLDARLEGIRVPALIMGGWYDLYSSDAFATYSGLRNRGSGLARSSQLIVGPWPHELSESTKVGDVDFGARSMIDLEALEMRWFSRWLRDEQNGIDEEAPLRLFVMGSNEWINEHEWPLARTDWQCWYLHSGGRANTLLGDGLLSLKSPGDEVADSFVYDPELPVQTNGGCNCCQPEIIPWGPFDQRNVEMRTDVLCYTSVSLQEDLTVIGPIKLVLWAVTDGRDTDWTAKLVDVRPSGYAVNLCDGIVRARWRDSANRRAPRLLEPGQIERYEIQIMVTANTFMAGHHIRVEISSSNFPRFDRNPNTGAPIGDDTVVRRARQIVLHHAAHPSHLVLPTIVG
jgi:putative CocE/NonD family hydrolase